MFVVWTPEDVCIEHASCHHSVSPGPSELVLMFMTPRYLIPRSTRSLQLTTPGTCQSSSREVVLFLFRPGRVTEGIHLEHPRRRDIFNPGSFTVSISHKGPSPNWCCPVQNWSQLLHPNGLESGWLIQQPDPVMQFKKGS